jgi:translation initiation factor 2 alpha subunit (eIF-2alpha)
VKARIKVVIEVIRIQKRRIEIHLSAKQHDITLREVDYKVTVFREYVAET